MKRDFYCKRGNFFVEIFTQEINPEISVLQKWLIFIALGNFLVKFLEYLFRERKSIFFYHLYNKIGERSQQKQNQKQVLKKYQINLRKGIFIT